MQKVKSPITWVGGKYHKTDWLLSLMPPHRTYVELFGGAAHLLFAKPPSPVEVYNDLNGDIVNLFRVMRDPDKFERFHRLVGLTPHSREEHDYACRHFRDVSLSDVERAALFLVAMHQSINGIVGSAWSRTTWESRRGMALKTSAWLGLVEGLPEVAERLLRVEIENRDFEDVIRAFDTEETLFYCDPSYLPGTRVASDAYQHEMSVDDHERMLGVLAEVKGKVMLSGYPNELYDSYLKGWNIVDFPISCRSTVGTSADRGSHSKASRIERVWMNYDPDLAFGSLFAGGS